MNPEPRIRLVPAESGSILAGIAWRVACHDCGYLTVRLAMPRALLAQRVHRHRHIVGRV